MNQLLACANCRTWGAFTCLNWTPKPHRTGVVAWLLARGHDAGGFISFNRFNKNAPDSNEIAIPAWFPELATTTAGLALLQQRSLTIDRPINDTAVSAYDLGPDFLYQDSYFSIITESNVFPGNWRFTEKCIKPLAMMHPFIVVGHARTLRLLREFGFETFGELFDESYDEVDDPSRRTAKILNELDRVLSQDRQTLHAAVKAMIPKLLRNAARARTILPRTYRETYDPQLIARLICSAESGPKASRFISLQ